MKRMSKSDERWEQYYKQWAHYSQTDLTGRKELVTEMSQALSNASPDELQWLIAALKLPGKKMFVASLLGGHTEPPMPLQLVEPMLCAAVYEINPSSNRLFIEPCVRAVGPLKVHEMLLEYLEKGTNFEKAGAINAHYHLRWIEPRLTLTVERADSFNYVLLKEFVENENLYVRRSIISDISLKPSRYPNELQSLVSLATHIACTHPDDYIRQCVELDLGKPALLFHKLKDMLSWVIPRYWRAGRHN
jgi:hypothetical protein